MQLSIDAGVSNNDGCGNRIRWSSTERQLPYICWLMYHRAFVENLFVCFERINSQRLILSEQFTS